MSTNVIPFHQPNALAFPAVSAADIEQALTIGDLSKMPPAVRIRYYLAACESAGLNPLTRPFTPMKDQSGQVLLYANKDAAEQLRKRDRISIRVTARDKDEGLYCVTVEASTPDGRVEESQGIVDISQLKGQPLANAMMKAETKAKRRVTLALCGLGFPLAEEGGERPLEVNWQTGEIRGEANEHRAVEAAGTATHIADLYGDAPPAPLHPIWRTIAGWYAESGIPEKYPEYESWACRRYRVGYIAEIQEQDLKDMAAKVYATLEPLIVARQMAQAATSVPRTGIAKAQEEEGLTIGSSMPASVPGEAVRGLKNDNGEDATSQGPSWVDADRNLFDEEEQAERDAMREDA